MALYTFPDTLTLRSYWRWKLGDLDQRPPETTEACFGGTVGVREWEGGQIACYMDDGRAKIRWFQTAAGTYGVLDSTGRDLAAIYSYWLDLFR